MLARCLLKGARYIAFSPFGRMMIYGTGCYLRDFDFHSFNHGVGRDETMGLAPTVRFARVEFVITGTKSRFDSGREAG